MAALGAVILWTRSRPPGASLWHDDGMTAEISAASVSGDWYATREAAEPLRCVRCGNRIGLAAFSLGDDGPVHDRCP